MARLNAPELGDVIIGWICNESYRSLWKVGKWYDFEDLVQDGLMLALKCRERYGDDIEPALLLSLIKTSFRNHIVDLQRRTGPELLIAEVEEIKAFTNEEEAFNRISPPLLPQQEMACVLSELPEPIKAVLRLFTSADSLRRLRLPMRETLTESETPAKRLKRLAGWPEEKDFASELKKLLFPG